MKIIRITPFENGAYPAVVRLDGNTVPEGYREITADTSEFYNGFIVPTIENNVVTSYICNTEAWEQWQAEHPTPEPTLDDITTLQLAVAELAETQAADQTANELALAELAEMMGG